jgi:hypothetical protein
VCLEIDLQPIAVRRSKPEETLGSTVYRPRCLYRHGPSGRDSTRFGPFRLGERLALTTTTTGTVIFPLILNTQPPGDDYIGPTRISVHTDLSIGNTT